MTGISELIFINRFLLNVLDIESSTTLRMLLLFDRSRFLVLVEVGMTPRKMFKTISTSNFNWSSVVVCRIAFLCSLSHEDKKCKNELFAEVNFFITGTIHYCVFTWEYSRSKWIVCLNGSLNPLTNIHKALVCPSGRRPRSIWTVAETPGCQTSESVLGPVDFYTAQSSGYSDWAYA